MQQDDWHYNDERSGRRVGPVGRVEVGKLVADKRIERSTLVWNPAMPDWAKAGTTDLAGLFGATPPPLPATVIRRWALFAVALFPFWGMLLRAAACSQTVDPRGTFDQPAWILFYIAGNTLLGWLDERNLEKAGLAVKGATIVSALVIPAYIYISCRTYRLHSTSAAWFAYAPLVMWFLALMLAIVQEPYIFD